MKCIVVVAGREAIPVRAIPFITGWMISPDVVASGFAMTDRWHTRLQDLAAFHLSADGHNHQMLPKEWDGIEADLRILSETLKAEEKIEGSGYPEWREKSILMLPSRCFVWRDEFERAFERAYGPDKVILIDERPGDRDINFSPLIPHAALDAVFDGFPGAWDGTDCGDALVAETVAQSEFEAACLAQRVDLPLHARAPDLSAEAFVCVINAVEPSKWKDERSRLDINAKTVKSIQGALKQAECDIDSGVLAPRNSPAVWLEWGRRRILHRAKLNTLDGQVKLHPAWENFESEVRRFETWKKAQEQCSTGEQAESSVPTPITGQLDSADDRGPDGVSESVKTMGGSALQPRGLSRRVILAADWPLHGPFTNASFSTALSDVPKWLEPARVGKGAPGKGSSLWNPAQIAVCLHEQHRVPVAALTRLIDTRFSDWSEEWEENKHLLI